MSWNPKGYSWLNRIASEDLIAGVEKCWKSPFSREVWGAPRHLLTPSSDTHLNRRRCFKCTRKRQQVVLQLFISLGLSCYNPDRLH